ncbi:MAG: ABC transporter permease [Dehalococcoidia bacterium]|nr:ABC transporter permease [Dehalococcoidia bacterium]
MKRTLGQISIVALLFVVWQAVVSFGLISRRLLPSPTDVLEVLPKMVGEGDLLPAIGSTALELVIATAIAVPFGILVGFLVGESPALTRAVGPFLYLWTAIPKSLFLPLFILSMGVGEDQKVAFGVFQAFFIIAVSTIAAVQSVPQGLLLVGRALRATRFQMYLRIYLPYMLPSVLQGVRIGVIFAGSGILFAEMLVSRVGLGRLINIWGSGNLLRELFAGVFIAALGTITLTELFRAYERRVGKWRSA